MSSEAGPSGSGRTTRRAAAAAARALTEQAEIDDFDSQSVASSSKGKRKAATGNTGSRKRATSEPKSDDGDSDYLAEVAEFEAQEDVGDDENDDDEEDDDEKTNKFAVSEGDSDDVWLIKEAERKNPHVPLTIAQRRTLEKDAGRGLIPWLRPLMNDKLLLFLCFELARHQIEVPWDAIAHRLHPGSSGGAILQHLARLRLEVASKGHLVPPAIPKTSPTGFSIDPAIRGYIRQDDEETGEVQLLPALYSEVWEDRKVNLPDGFDANLKLQAAELQQRKSKGRTQAKGKGKGKARKIAAPRSRKNGKAAQSARRGTGEKTIPKHPKKKTTVVNDDSAIESELESEGDENSDPVAARDHSDDDDDAAAPAAAPAAGSSASAANTTPSSAAESGSPATEASGSDMNNNVNISTADQLNIFMANDSVLSDTEMQSYFAVSQTAAVPKMSFTEFLQTNAGGASPIHGFSQTLGGYTAGTTPHGLPQGVQFDPATLASIDTPEFTVFEDETRTEAKE